MSSSLAEALSSALAAFALRHLVHLGDSGVDLVDALRLLAGSSGHLGNKLADFARVRRVVFDRLEDLLVELNCLAYTAVGSRDQLGGVLGRLGAALCKAANLLGDDREAFARLAGPRGLDCGVERQQVRLEGYFVDGP